MANKFVPHEDDECFVRGGTIDRLYVKDDVARISWSYPTQSSIQQLLQFIPSKICRQLGLVRTFSIPYSEPMTHAVKEFAQGFNPLRNDCDFRGRKLAFTMDVLRKAFSLPSGKFTLYKDHWSDAVELESPRIGVNHQIALFQELVLGKQNPQRISFKHMWYFNARFTSTERSGKPDYAELVHVGLKQEIVELKEYLDSSKDEREDTPMRKINCGTAVTQILLHLGFTREELSHPTSLTRNTLETDKIESPVGTSLKTSYSVKRMCKQVDTAEPSAAWLGKEEKRDNKKQRSLGGESIPGSGGEIDTTSPTCTRSMLDPMLDLQVDEEGQFASTGIDKSAHAASIDLWQTLEENLRIQLHSARIQIQAGTTERDSALAALLLEKNNIESQLRTVNLALAAALEAKREITQILEKELNKAYEDNIALKTEKSQLETAYETSQEHLEVEKEKNLCQICWR